MNYEIDIVNKLLDKYERSQGRLSGSFSQRIRLKIAEEHPYPESEENAYAHQEFLSAVALLHDLGIISYDWVRYEQGNLVKDIWLNLDHVEQAYRHVQRTPLSRQATSIISYTEDTLQRMTRDTCLKSCVAQHLSRMKEKQKPYKLFEDPQLLDTIAFINDNNDQINERVLSVKLFGDSKYFERNIRNPLLTVLRQAAKIDREETPNDNDLLLEYGVSRWPEVMEFCGPLTFCLKDGGTVDYTPLNKGAYVNSDTVKEIDHILTNATSIMSIENKANYVAYLPHRRNDELVLYHGGFCSPMKQRFFQMIQSTKHFEVFHWSDIDAGGFRIFLQLKENIFPHALPWRMDLETLKEYEDMCMHIDNDRYLHILEDMIMDQRYSLFHDVISYMLEKRIRLEQENIIA